MQNDQTKTSEPLEAEISTKSTSTPETSLETSTSSQESSKPQSKNTEKTDEEILKEREAETLRSLQSRFKEGEYFPAKGVGFRVASITGRGLYLIPVGWTKGAQKAFKASQER